MDAIERGFRFGGAVVVASLAAGPIFGLGAVLLTLPVNSEALGWGLVLLLFWTIPYGAIFAFLPNLIGTAIMTALGAWFAWARSPFAWVGAGGLGGALVAAWFARATATEWHFLALLILTGMACAAICRAFTGWPDPDDDAQA